MPRVEDSRLPRPASDERERQKRFNIY